MKNQLLDLATRPTKIVLFLLLILAISSSISASHIELQTDKEVFPLLNRRSNKIINYYQLQPGASIQVKTFEVDSLQIYTRLIMNGNKDIDYNYLVDIDGRQYKVERSAKASRITRGLNGDEISAYNTFVKKIPSDNTIVSVSNTSSYNILVKISANNVISEHRVIDYIKYSPQEYGNERTMVLRKKTYTYYEDKDGSIKLTLEGPIVLKIMSRFVFSRNYVNSKQYGYRVYSNGNLLGDYQEIAHKSPSSYLRNEEEKMLSTGDSNILKLPRGVHNLSVENRDSNLDVIFRFFISKSSIDIEEE
ncbi:MAG: hypothetical protein R6U84_02495 [Candidatus Cloacimonadales bacterium]